MADASQRTVTRTFGAIPIPFVAKIVEYQEKNVVWKIDNVANLLAMSNDELHQNGLTFEAGSITLQDGTEVSATWKYYFECPKENGETLFVGHLCLYSESAGTRLNIRPVNASYFASLSSGGNQNHVACCIVEFKEFDGMCGWGHKLTTKSDLLEKTKETNSMEVTLTLMVFPTEGIQVEPVGQECLFTLVDATEMRGQMTSDLKKILDSGDGADVEVRVPKEIGGEVDESSYSKMVHKCFLMGRSSVFAKMFGKESEMVEAKTGKVVIRDLSPKGLDIFLHYIYTGEVLIDFVHFLPELLNAAEKYDCGELWDFCAHNLQATLTTANAVEMLKLAKLHSLSCAAKGVLKFIQKNAIEITEEGIDKVSDPDIDTDTVE